MTQGTDEEHSYDPGYFAPIAGAEQRHFWFRARNRILGALMKQAAREVPAGSRVLEVGCGTGNVTRTMIEVFGAGAVTAMEPFEEGYAIAARRLPCKVVKGDLENPPVTGPFSFVGMFDVLEHLPNEGAALASVKKLLTPGGLFLLTVPAHESLWSYFDEQAGHFRRYETTTLTRALTRAGFQVEYASEFFALLFPALWASRRLAALRSGRGKPAKEQVLGELRVVPVVNGIMEWILSREVAPIERRRHIPLGTSIVALARAPRG
jgi:SAM-dependent methyltransferase